MWDYAERESPTAKDVVGDLRSKFVCSFSGQLSVWTETTNRFKNSKIDYKEKQKDIKGICQDAVRANVI